MFVFWWKPGALSLRCSGRIYIFLTVYRRLISQPLPWSLCRAFNFQRHSRKCHLLPFDRFSHGAQRQPNANFTLYEKKGRRRRQGGASSGLRCRGGGGGGGGFSPRVFGFSLEIINRCVPPLALPLLNHSLGPSRMDKQAACLIVNNKSYCL